MYAYRNQLEITRECKEDLESCLLYAFMPEGTIVLKPVHPTEITKEGLPTSICGLMHS